MADYAAMCETAREAAAAASRVCRSVQAQLGEISSLTKDDRSPVTVADFASQAVVAHLLQARLGAVRLVAEEDAAALRESEPGLAQQVLEAARVAWPDATLEQVLDAIDVGNAEPSQSGFWTLDPIDGTKGFLRKQQYAVALAYIDHGNPAVAALACPNLPRSFSAPVDAADPEGSMYFAVRNEGCYESVADDANAEATRLTPLQPRGEGAIAIAASVEQAHTSGSEVDSVLSWITEHHGLPVGESVRLDSQCKYAVVARGQADAYLRLPTKKGYVERIWDHAAGALVAAEMNCGVTDARGAGLDFTQGKGLEANRGIVCAAPRLHGMVMEALEALKLTPPPTGV